jgi:hypothetical protein
VRRSIVGVSVSSKKQAVTVRRAAELPDLNIARLGGIASLTSLFSFFYYFRHGDLLLYGDAVAHINIARRVFDSLTPGPLQLGTVWLPLPHLLMIPFIFFDSMWQNGAGGSIPSMIAYVFAVLGIFRLGRGILESNPRTRSAASVGAWAAAAAFGANPNLIYMQTTAMTESIYLAFFIWAVAFFAEFVRTLPDSNNKNKNEKKAIEARPLMHCAGCLAGAELTRYDGWFLAGAVGISVVVIVLRRWQNRNLRRIGVKFLIWLAYNGAIYGNVWEFANGPFSAKAIEQRVGATNPALHNAGVAAIYFLKSAQLNMAVDDWGRFWLAAAVLALAIGGWKLRAQSVSMLLLWIPIPFYAFSIAYGSVPIHVYTWWPFATFNQRYGLQLLPALSVSAGMLAATAYLLGSRRNLGRKHGAKLVALIIALVVVGYASVWKAEPQCLKEARRNWEIRQPLNSSVQRIIARFPRNSRYLMDLGEHVGIMEQAGIPLRQVVNNENHRPWKRPTDPEGLWEQALADPSRYVDYVIAFDGDVVDQEVNKTNLSEYAEIHATGQPHAHIYMTQRANQSR